MLGVRRVASLLPLLAIGVEGCSLVVDLSGLGGDAATEDVSTDTSSQDGGLDVAVVTCDAAPPTVADDQAVWVSHKLGADSALCGTKLQPCATVTIALTHATAQSLHVIYLDDSTYAESISIGADFAGGTIQGGWHIANGAWTAQCTTAASVLAAPGDAGAVALDIASSSDVTLRLLTIESKVAGSFGESVYAMRVVDTPNVVLDHVVLVAQNGGDGTSGNTGPSGTGCTISDAGSGANGGPGSAGGAGTFASQGFVPAQGGAGSNGALGTKTPPSNGACGTCAMCTLMNVKLIDGGPGDGGFGEAGCNTSFVQTCAQNGQSGCAGGGGGGGPGGAGGGAAITLYAWGASTTVSVDGAMITGSGGKGGAGGSGGQGASGVSGASGAGVLCSSSCSGSCSPTGGYALDGGAGGSGGTGGQGGQGGGGAGGPIYLYAAMGGATISVSPETASASSLGTPGGGGAPNGPNGAQGDHP